jgi:DNA-binding response OmpR family regulator
MKILLAEDDYFFQKLEQQILTPDYEVIVAQDGDEAWAILQSPEAPRLAILDWVMPGLSGPEVCRKVRACPALSSMYLIILTAKNSEADIVSGLRAGADDYITKPPLTAGLRARVRVGQRVLELQNAVQAQSKMAERPSRCESLLAHSPPTCPAGPRLDSVRGNEAEERQTFGVERGRSTGKADPINLRLSITPMEKRHPHR